MIKVYFESKNNAELVAVFSDEEIYAACLASLEKLAKKSNLIVTESVDESAELEDVITLSDEEENRIMRLARPNEGY